MDPLVTSALISTGGSLVSGLFGGDKKQKIDYEGAQRAQDTAQRNDFAIKMDLASKYNIHPLAMLGTSSPSISAPVYESKSNNMGQNVASALAKGASDYYTGRANREVEALALERARLENDLLRSQITSINRSPSTTTSAPQATNAAQGGKYPPLIVNTTDEDGKTVPVLNPDYNSEPMEWFTSFRDTGPAIVKNAAKRNARAAVNAVKNNAKQGKYKPKNWLPNRQYMRDLLR